MYCLKLTALVIATSLQGILRDLCIWFSLCQKHLDSLCHSVVSVCQRRLDSCLTPPGADDLSSICFGVPALGKLPFPAAPPPLPHWSTTPERGIWDSLTLRALSHYLQPLYLCVVWKYLPVASVLLPNSHLRNVSAFLLKYRPTVCLSHHSQISLRMEALS